MNKITNLGNLGRDAEVRLVPRANGSLPVVNFSLAVKVGFGENERTEWRDCSFWGERAQKVSRWLTKGKQLIVEGRPWLKTYEKRDKSMAATIAIEVEDIWFVGGKPAEGAASAAPAARPEEGGTVTTVTNPAPASQPPLDEDVPF